MDRVVEAYQPVAQDEGKSLRSDHHPAFLVVGDSELLAPLFTNLIENAINQTPAPARISTTLGMVDGEAVATVAGDGLGVPEGERQRILTRFYRLNTSRNTPG